MDILRTKDSNGNLKSFICDVNGWSFVKGNEEFSKICGTKLREYILKQIKLLTN